MRAHVLLIGRVQGVRFRVLAQRRANALGLVGWARNRPDGRFEAVAEGDVRMLARFLAWCRRGPARAVVRRVDLRIGPATGRLTRFGVRAAPGEDPPGVPLRSDLRPGRHAGAVRVRVRLPFRPFPSAGPTCTAVGAGLSRT